MHILDVIAVCLAVLVLLALVAVLARQRFMLRAPGAVPVAVRTHSRWRYGVARYAGNELRWYSSLGIGTRPNRTLNRGQVSVVSHRRPVDSELTALPGSAVIVECRDGDTNAVLALGEGAYTGFVSWLESAPST